MRRASILTSLYDGTPFLSTRTNKNDGTWQRPSVPLRFLEIPLPCTRFRSFRLRRESNLDYGKHVCVVVEADKVIILLAFVGDHAKAALLVVLREKNRHKAFVVLVISFSIASFFFARSTLYVSYVEQRRLHRPTREETRFCSEETRSSLSYALRAFICERKKKEEKLVTWKPPRSGKVFSYGKRFSNISRLQSWMLPSLWFL